MSYTRSVVLCTSFHERDIITRRSTNWDRIDTWLMERGFLPLTRVEQWALVGCGEFNHINEDDFAAFVMSLDWGWPENVVLIIQPQEGATRVWRPAGVA